MYVETHISDPFDQPQLADLVAQLFDPLGLGSELGKIRSIDGGYGWFRPKDNDGSSKLLTPERALAHWRAARAEHTASAAPASWTRWVVWDFDVDVDAPDLDAAQRATADAARQLLGYLADQDITPVVVSSPSGGYHVIAVPEAPVERGALGSWAARILDAACPDRAVHVDVFPTPSGGAKTIRLPLGRGFAKAAKGQPPAAQAVDTRLLDGRTLEPLGSSRLADLEFFQVYLACASVPLGHILDDPEAAGYQRDAEGGWALSAAKRAEIAADPAAAGQPPAISLAVSATVPLVREAPVPAAVTGGELSEESLYGPGWAAGVEQILAGEILPGSEGLWASVRPLVFELRVRRGLPAGEVLEQVLAWAEAHGQPPKAVAGMVRRAIGYLDVRLAAGDLALGLRPAQEILGLRDAASARPRLVVPRLLAEDAVVEHILAQVPGYLRDLAGHVLAHLRAHGTISQAELDGLPRAQCYRPRRSVCADDAGGRSRLGKLARDSLTRGRVLRKYRAHSTGRHSAVYVVDYAAALELRAELGLPPIVVAGRLVHREDDPVIQEAAVGDTARNAAGQEVIAPRAVAQLLLGDGLLEKLVEERPEAAEIIEKIAAHGSVRPAEVAPELQAQLAPLFGPIAANRFGLRFAEARALRRELGLAEVQIHWDGRALAAPWAPEEEFAARRRAQEKRSLDQRPARTPEACDIAGVLVQALGAERAAVYLAAPPPPPGPPPAPRPRDQPHRPRTAPGTSRIVPYAGTSGLRAAPTAPSPAQSPSQPGPRRQRRAPSLPAPLRSLAPEENDHAEAA